MGTRYEDQPPEHWAGPESLDPTPVWKQFFIVGLLLTLGLVMIGIFAYLALGAQFAAPPALVPGGRLVLARSEVPRVGAPPKRVGTPLVGEAQTFYLTQPENGEIVALRALWAPGDQFPACLVEPGSGVPFAVRCGADFVFGRNGEPTDAPRALDRYLVSIEGERIVVNLSRVISGYGKIPQPTLEPLR